MSGLLPASAVSPLIFLAAFATAVIVAVILAPLVIQGGPVDNPRGRGSHERPTPTSGGLAIMAASALAIGLVLGLSGRDIPGSWRDGLALFGFASILGVSGAIDDMLDMPPKLRLIFQAIICLIFAYFYRATDLRFGFGLDVAVWPPLGLIFSALWLMLGINAINFMDGSNGLAIGVQSIALLSISAVCMLAMGEGALGAYLGLILLISLAGAGANLGLLPFNLSFRIPNHAKLFQGDAGALFSGGLISGGVLVLKAYDAEAVWFGGFLLAPLLVDVVLTLLTRMSQRKDVFRAHHEHLYQVWLQRRDGNHAHVAWIVWALCAATSVTGLLAHIVVRVWGLDLRFPLLVVVIAGLSFAWFRIRRRLLAV
ncbi:MAG: glycosyltransferase family 4 protein [Asticcacaulis sp.]